MDRSAVRDHDSALTRRSDAYYDDDDIFGFELGDATPIGSPGLAASFREPEHQDLEASGESSDAEITSVGSPATFSSISSHSDELYALRERRSTWREWPRISERLSRSLDDPSSEEEFIGSPGKAPRHVARRGSLGPFGAAAIFLGVCFGTIGLAKIAKHGPATLPDFDKCEGGICNIPGSNF